MISKRPPCDSDTAPWALVVLELDSERFFLDPVDCSLAFGALRPSLQGVPCLLVEKKKQEWTETPQLGAEQSVQEARTP